MDCFCTAVQPCGQLCGVSISALSDRGLLLGFPCILIHDMSSFNIRSFGSWIASSLPIPLAQNTAQFQYPLFRIVDCFIRSMPIPTTMPCGFNIRSFGSWIASTPLSLWWNAILNVSISALSDRGLLQMAQGYSLTGHTSFNIRSFGSWIASSAMAHELAHVVLVSISALSDRGLLLPTWRDVQQRRQRFNIRSFGSWIASWAYADHKRSMCRLFQYPLFRIVDCFLLPPAVARRLSLFQYPLFRIVDCFSSKVSVKSSATMFQYPLFRIVDCFRVMYRKSEWETKFQYPLFRIVDCFNRRRPVNPVTHEVSISALSDRGLLRAGLQAR